MIYFFAGFVLGEVFARVNHYVVIIISVIAMVIVYLYNNKFGRSRLWLVLPLFFCFGSSMLSSACKDSEFERIWKMNAYTEEYVTVNGKVQKTDIYDKGQRITLVNVHIGIDNVMYKCNSVMVYIDGNNEQVVPGDDIVVYGNISRINKATNPGQFDMQKYYEALNIEFAVNAGYLEVAAHDNHSILSMLYRVRRLLQSELKKIALPEDYEVLSAMLLGDENEIGDDLESLYRLSGIAHILTISGLHISMIGRGLYMLLRKLGGGFVLSSLISSGIILMYGVMTGFGTSSLRAVIMFLVMLTADCLGKSYDMTSSVSFAGILVLCEFPLMIYQFSFQMSVVCIYAISLIAPVVQSYLGLERGFLNTIVTGCVIQWCTIPVLLYHMYTYPVFSVLINLAVIPLVKLVMVSGFFSMVLSFVKYDLAMFMSGTAHYILLFYKKLCEFVCGIECALITPGQPDIVMIVIYYTILLAGFNYMSYKVAIDKKITNEQRRREKNNRKKQSYCKRYAFVAAFLIVSILILILSRQKQMVITFADVGQGDCTLVRTISGDTALIDCGSSNITEVGAGRIIPMLNYYGIKRIDYMFLSHADSDHINGAAELIENIKVNNIFLPDRADNSGFSEITALAKAYDVPIWYIGSGNKVALGDVSFICLNPIQNDNTNDENNSSMVLKLEYKEFSVLFTGDLDIAGEEKVADTAKAYEINIDCDVLKVGHHGSKYSTGEAFLEEVTPKSSVISCSESNTYGHPSEEVIERLGSCMSDIYITKDSGAVIVKTNGIDYSIYEFCK